MITEDKLDKKQFTSDQMDIMQPISQSILPERPALVDGCQDYVPVELSSLTARPIVIASNSIRCQVKSSCQIEFFS